MHEIFTYGLKGSFLILFAASDKLIQKKKIKKVWVPFHSCLQNDWSKMFSVSGMLGSHIHQFSWQRTRLIRICTDVFKIALTRFRNTTLQRPQSSFPCSKCTITSFRLLKITQNYHMRTMMCTLHPMKLKPWKYNYPVNFTLAS